MRRPRAHPQLQDPADKREIRCDAKLRRVFDAEKVNMFKMNKFLGACVRFSPPTLSPSLTTGAHRHLHELAPQS
jgi:chromatin remodeling complex protein RSC6